MKNVVKKYSNDDVTVIWDSKKCKHAAECVKNAPNVFRPKEQPWIQMENDTTENIKAAIDKYVIIPICSGSSVAKIDLKPTITRRNAAPP